VLRRRIAEQLIDALNIDRIKTRDGAVVMHANAQPPAPAVGERHQLGGQAIGVGDVTLELLPAVFAAREQWEQVGFGHEADAEGTVMQCGTAYDGGVRLRNMLTRAAFGP
jgi:hypothetical protein